MVIAPGTYSDGTYKRTSPQIIGREYFDLSNSEKAAKQNGKRGCTLAGADMPDIANKCINAATALKAKSWSIWPIPYTNTVLVEFHNWPEMGMCNFDRPVAKTRYWWDVRPVPDWISPADGEKTHFTEEPFDPEA